MDHINLDDRETYRREQALLFKMPAGKLKKVVAGLYEIRFIDQEESVDAYYRLAVSVQLKRSKTIFNTFQYGCWIALMILVSSLYKVFY